MAIDMEKIHKRIQDEILRQREALAWFEHRRTWSPVMTEQQKQEHDEYVKKHQLPF